MRNIFIRPSRNLPKKVPSFLCMSIKRNCWDVEDVTACSDHSIHTFIRLFINVTFSFPSQTCLIEIILCCVVVSVCVCDGLWRCIMLESHTVCFNIASSLLFHIDTQFFDVIADPAVVLHSHCFIFHPFARI